ncbi:2-enoyl thioester reductase domain-containing protein [Sphingobium sp.]|uniref:MDR family NADPH-dependent oxidoreductase n=1 Tax=Sphingobium sp. TaxID=1912891 RepID=UPI002B866DA1|nr:2-enoyl thioester reductase domain-containing protein [Sphingobium sp.]HUD95656.1 2-enoyl thioester reductase domain-containing protein [Sphingobium sp.]
MRAILLREGGGIRLADIPDAPRPGVGEIRIAMRLTPVNPADHLAVEGRHLTDAYGMQKPVGAEGLGIVEAIGPGVQGLAVGDRILPLDRGNWVERRTIPADRVIRAPDMLADEQASIFRINPATAHRLLTRVDLCEGDWIIQNAAGSMVGRIITAIGKARGLNILCVVRSPELARERLSTLGAAAVIAQGETMADEAIAAMEGARARLALDFVTGEETGRLARCIGPGGRVTISGHLGKEPCLIPGTLLTTGNIIIDGYSLRMDEGPAGRTQLQAMYDRLAPIYRDNPAVLPELVRCPLAAFEDAVTWRGPEKLLLDWTRI